MIIVALLAALAVAVGSYWLGDRWVNQELEKRFSGIERSLAESNFPLNANVLDLLADLTQTEFVGRDSLDHVTHGTIKLSENERDAYRVYSFSTRDPSQRQDKVARIEVLFEQKQIDDSRRRAAILPLVTGLSTILALTTVTIALTSRWVRRLGKLRHQVELVASGNFESNVSDEIDDEIGRLGQAVDSMAAQLSQLWKQINRQQSAKLLHQIAGGMAHQLRNSLTGARMAVELHAKRCSEADDESIDVAIRQIETSEDYVRRLLLVASGRQDEDRPMQIRACYEDVRRSLSPISDHLRVTIQWHIDDAIQQQTVADGPTWIAAASNLIHNALQAGDEVHVSLQNEVDELLCLTVTDNGAGIPESVAPELFEPFVTSKPEGMGLGLSVVRQAAKRLGGDVRWSREEGRTRFEFGIIPFSSDGVS